MALNEYLRYVEADNTATDNTRTGTGIVSDPIIGRGDHVLNHTISDTLIGWGAGTGANPAWARGDHHVIMASNKEAYVFQDTAEDAITINGTWTGTDTHGSSFEVRPWETTSYADGGTFIEWPNGERAPCIELDGDRVAQVVFQISSIGPVILRNCKFHSFTTRGLDGNATLLDGCEFYNYDGEAIDNGTGDFIYNCWFHDAYDTAAYGISGCYGADRCVFGPNPGRQRVVSRSRYTNCVFFHNSDYGPAIAADGNFDNWSIEDCIFIGDGAADSYAIDINGNSAPSKGTIRNCLFINYNGTGAHPVREPVGGNGEGAIQPLLGNFYYNCNANDVKHDEIDRVDLQHFPLFNASPDAWDFRVIARPELYVPGREWTAKPRIWAPWGMVDDAQLFTAGGVTRVPSFIDIPNDDE